MQDPAPTSQALLTGSMMRHISVAFFAAIVLVAGVGGWASTTEISGAVIATGRVEVDTHAKEIQHREGGIIREILVRNGDSVAAGDLLVRLDNTVTRANLTAVTERLEELEAQKARLVAERDDLEQIEFQSGSADAGSRSAAIAAGQKNLMAARDKSLAGRLQQLSDQIDQFRQQLEGLRSQHAANVTEGELIKDELAGLETLLEKQLVPKNRVVALQREQARLLGARGDLTAQIARVEEAISERKSQIIQIEEDRQADILEQLQAVSAEITQLAQQRVTAQDALARSDIRAPQSGVIHKLNVFTVGGVVAPGESLMQVVPQEDLLVIRAKIQPVDVDQVYSTQEAGIRLPNFNQRVTPELAGRVVTVSADLTEDKQTGLYHYDATLAFEAGELAKLAGKSIVPGMPAEIFIRTDRRTVLSYLIKPFRDQIAHALRES